MKVSSKTASSFIALMIATTTLSSVATAGIGISDFLITDSSMSFDISGTLSGPTPPFGNDVLYFVNNGAEPAPFVLPASFETPLSHTWTGSQSLNPSFPVFTGNPSFGDYFGVYFNSALSVGEAVSGKVTATFAPGTFQPTAVSSIKVVWGSGDSSFAAGTTQAIFAVPEPSSALLISTLGFGLLARRRRVA